LANSTAGYLIPLPAPTKDYGKSVPGLYLNRLFVKSGHKYHPSPLYQTLVPLNRVRQTGKTDIIKGFKSKAGKNFEAILVLQGGKVEFKFSVKEQK